MVAVESRQPAIEGDQPLCMFRGERHEIRVGHLPLPEHAAELGSLVRKCVGPEPMPWLRTEHLEDGDRLVGCVTFTQQEPDEGSFGDRASVHHSRSIDTAMPGRSTQGCLCSHHASTFGATPDFSSSVPAFTAISPAGSIIAE